MTEKSPAEVIAEKLEKSNVAAEKNAEMIAELAKSTQSLAQTVEVMVNKSAKDEEISKSASIVEELKNEVELLKAKDVAGRQAFVGGASEESRKTEELNSLAKSLRESRDGITNFADYKSIYSPVGTLKKSMLVSYDNSTAGAAVKEAQILGQINVNLQTSSPITSVVRNLNGGKLTQNQGFTTFDESLVDDFESLEGKAKEQSDLVKNGTIELKVGQISAKMPVTDNVIFAAQNSEFTFNPINQTLIALDKRFEKKVARQVLNGNSATFEGIFTKAHKSDFRGKVVESANDNYITLEDLSRLGLNLKGEYLRNSVIIIDRAALYDLYQEPAEDGHLKIEQFDYNSSIAALRTAERVIPLIGVDSSVFEIQQNFNDGFASYKSFADGTTEITTGYCPKSGYPTELKFGGSTYSPVTDNAGKAAAILADFNSAYAVLRSTAGRMGLDDSLKDLLDLGYGVAGKIGYVGGKTLNSEAINILSVK